MAGILFGYCGDWERGVELTTRAMALNPHHPGWYGFTTCINAYRQRRYADALVIAQKLIEHVLQGLRKAGLGEDVADDVPGGR